MTSFGGVERVGAEVHCNTLSNSPLANVWRVDYSVQRMVWWTI